MRNIITILFILTTFFATAQMRREPGMTPYRVIKPRQIDSMYIAWKEQIEKNDSIVAALVNKAASSSLSSYVPTSRTINGQELSGNITLFGNINNTSDANKPVSTAQQTALDLKANIASPTFTGTVSGITKSMVGLSNVDNTSDASKPISIVTQTALDGKSATGHTHTISNITDFTDVDLLAYAALGSAIVGETVQQKLAYANTSTNMVDGQVKYTAIYLPKAATLTGVKFYVRVLGSYTGDNNNRVGLYSYSGGTLTLVASSANSGTLWTSAANAVQTIPFSSTYAANAGIYYVGFLYNQSAQTTAPALASGTAFNNVAMAGTAFGFTNSAKLHGTSNGTDLPASIAMTSITGSVIPSWTALY